MEHLHLKKCPSTQLFLKEKFECGQLADEATLVSASCQTGGVGRQQRSWIHFDNALAFSFTLSPNDELTLTPLEVGAILTHFLRNFGHEIFLKWPNDLLNRCGQKCGGILCNFLDEGTVVAGVGLNMGTIDTTTPFEAGTLDDGKTLLEEEKSIWPAKMYHHILKNRLLPKEVLQTWSEHCFHQGKEVTIVDGKESFVGEFEGIGDRGEALVGGRSFNSGSIESYRQLP